MSDLPLIRAAGVLFLCGEPPKPQSFLLMRHPDRWDLPKGHCDGEESFLETAVRETEEETGLKAENYSLDHDFRFDIKYPVQGRRGVGPRMKHVRYFLAWIDQQVEIAPTEHPSYQWKLWADHMTTSPMISVQKETIDPLLCSVKEYLAGQRPVE